MPILNMNYGANKGGANIGEPSNLSVTATSDSATITWTDNDLNTIPQSAFFKSVLVRKTGSAPTSPSDGTLVVTETVKNTYSSNGYTDTGLTEGTTYYYQVFSYSDLGGITYGTPVSVTPQSGWTPGVNTIAYYPLTSTTTVNDMSGNNYTLTNSSVTFGVNQGVDCAVSDGSNQLYATISTIPSGASARTISVWLYISSATLNAEYNTVGYGQNALHKSYQIYQSGQNNFSIRVYYDDPSASWNNDWYQHWINIVAIYDGTTTIMYINGNQVASSTVELDTAASAFYIGKSPFVGNGTIGYISEVILENKAWTPIEVSNYYGQTKGDYGIS